MLRTYAQDLNIEHVTKVLEKFNLGFDLDTAAVNILSFECLTPDSFVWEINMYDLSYFLYAEDYIPSINHVKAEISDYIGNDSWEFVLAKTKTIFESSSPVRTADVYKPPDRLNDVMKYAVDSGYDFAFLARCL